ncbi:reprolysin-like metallopeptidase [Modestobacter sp. SYSU DS0290]
MSLALRQASRRLVVCAALSVALSTSLLAGSVVRAEAAPAAAGETVVGELVQAYADPEHLVEHADGHPGEEPATGEDPGLLSWVQPDDGDAVRVPTTDVDELPVGATVEVTVGRTVHDDASAEGLEPARDVLAAEVVAAPAPVPTAPATGPVNHPVTVVMVQPAGTTRTDKDATLDQVAAVVDGPVAEFWSEQSGGAVQFGVTARVDWITTSATCSQPVGIWQAAATAASWQGLPSEHLMVYVPQTATACSYGLGTVGRSVDAGGMVYVRDTLPSVIAHEFGHNMGLGHSSARQCDSSVDMGTCQVTPYHDWYDVMGISWEQMGSLASVHAARMGFLPSASVATADPAGGTYTLERLDLRQGAHPRALRVVDAQGAVYWLEYRAGSTGTGRDAWLSSSSANRIGLQSGLLVRREATGDSTSLLLDGSPSAAPNWGADRAAALPVGTLVPLADTRLGVTVQSVTATELTLVVRTGAPIPQAHAALGGNSGPLGAPTTAVSCAGDTYCTRQYERGTIVWSPATGARAVSGGIRGAWAGSGGLNGLLRYPTGDMVCGLSGGGCGQQFQGGVAYWSPATGTRVVSGGILGTWRSLGLERGALGYPVSEMGCGFVAGGCGQHFQGGAVYWSPATGARAVSGGIGGVWARLGWENGPLRYPSGDMVCGLSGGGCGQQFEGGVVYWSPATGTRVVSGGILGTWRSLGLERGPLGYPVSEMGCGFVAGGCGQHFQGGAVYWSPATGARAVSGGIGGVWAGLGWENGLLRYPSGDMVCGLSGGGCGQQFEGGVVYWSPATGAHAVSGGFLGTWTGQGRENGQLGYPTVAMACGSSSCRQGFQGGELLWSPETGVRYAAWPKGMGGGPVPG